MDKDRIVLLDAVRGLAILGILPCNAPTYSHVQSLGLDFPLRWPHSHGGASAFIWWLTEVAFDKRFVTLFSMLFGVSIFLVGGERGDPQRSAVLRRRLFWLAVFGVIHGALIWHGDILLPYAVAGAVVMLARSWSPRRLLTVGLGVFLAFRLLAVWGNLYAAIASHFTYDNPGLAQAIASQTAAFAGDFRSSLAANFATWRGEIFKELFATGLITSGPMMLIGLGLHKLGFFTGRLARGIYLALVGAAAVATVGMAAVFTADVAADYTETTSFIAEFFRVLFAPFIAVGYAAGLTLLMASRRWSALPRLLAPVGHMAFTNYLTQSLLMTVIFYGGRGPDLFGQLDRPQLALIVVAVWIVQIVWSHLWLRRFRTGPGEWLWRRLYRGSGPERRAEPAPEIVPA